MNIIQAMSDPNVFADHFRDTKSWTAWRSFLVALFGLRMTADQLAIFRQCTGRDAPPKGGTNEAWLVIGRRGGKSFVLALIAVFLASFRDYRKYLGPGERATIVVIAADRKQARTILRYCVGLLESVPMLANTIQAKGQEHVDLANSITIEIHTASWRTVRGYTVVAALCDEIAFWRTDDDAANPDTEILAALKPAMATIPNAMLLCASSPYARRGALWDAFKRYHRHDGPVLVWNADTRTMNPRVPQSYIDAETEKDPAAASAEYGGQFRTDVEQFLSREAIDACVSLGVRENTPISNVRYRAFVDPSGGSQDSFTLAISHRESGKVIVDAIRERRPPFSPEQVVDEFADVLKSYGIHKVHGDRYAGEWPREQFRKRGITYEVCEMPKSDLYRDLLPAINSRRVQLLDHPRLISQLANLERRTARSGKDSIDHAPGAHDDIANAVAGAVSAVASHAGPIRVSPEAMEWSRRPYDPKTARHRFSRSPRVFLGTNSQR